MLVGPGSGRACRGSGRAVSRSGFLVERGRESVPTREGATAVRGVPSGKNSKCKGPGVREGERVHGIPSEVKRGWCELL